MPLSASLSCSRCGFVNAPGHRFCTNCGSPLVAAPPTAAAPPPAYPQAAYPPPGYAPPTAPPPAYPGAGSPGYGGYAPPGYAPPAYWYPPPPRAKAGTMIGDTLHVWGKNFLEYFAVYLLLAVITTGFSFALTALAFGVPGIVGGVSLVPSTPGNIDVGLFALVEVAVYFVTAIVGAIFLGAVTYFAFHAHRSSPVSLGQSFQEAFRRFLSIFGANLLITVILVGLFVIPLLILLVGALTLNVPLILAGCLVFVIAIPVAIYLFLGFSVFAPVVMVEGAGAISSLERSWHLTRGHRLSILGAGIVIGIIAGLISAAIVAVGDISAVFGGVGGLAILFVATVLAGAITNALLPILSVVAYSLLRADEDTSRQVMSGYGVGPPAAAAPMAPPSPPPSPPVPPGAPPSP